MTVVLGRDSGAVLAAVEALTPRIQAAGDEIERQRRLPPALVAALAEAGLFRLLLPREYGGAEVDPLTHARVLELVARADGSTAWCVGQAAGCAIVGAYLEPAVAHAIFDDPGAILASGQGPASRAVVVDGGYRVTGRWEFLSGCHHATWFGGVCTLHDLDGQPRRGADGAPETRLMLFRPADAEIIDVWEVSGLRGTGSDTITVTDLFVPAAYTARLDPDLRRVPRPLYVYPQTSLFAVGFAAVALGLARGLLDALLELAGRKTPRGLPNTLRDSPLVQARIARAEARLRAARALLHTTVAEAWEVVGRTGRFPLARRVDTRLATTHAIHAAAAVADEAYHAAGATAIFASQPFERRFRDIHAVTQQIHGREAHYETVGRHLLGLDAVSPFL